MLVSQTLLIQTPLRWSSGNDAADVSVLSWAVPSESKPGLMTTVARPVAGAGGLDKQRRRFDSYPGHFFGPLCCWQSWHSVGEDSFDSVHIIGDSDVSGRHGGITVAPSPVSETLRFVS